MRLLFLILALALAAGPARAAEWTHYENPRFGYEIAIPPGFGPDGPPPANGDGQVFISDDGTQLLRVYGGHVVDGSFEAIAGRAMDAAEDAGWALSYERVTPRWTSYSGTRGGMILYARGIALCGGTQFASFEIEYPDDDLEWMHAVIDRLMPSLKASGSGVGC
jgi:hypothetical protein